MKIGPRKEFGQFPDKEFRMQSKLNPYINFLDNTREAMTFYKQVFGGKLTISTFREFHMGDSNDPAELDKVMHSMLEAENGIVFMASDTPKGLPFNPGSNVSMSLSGDDEKELRGYFDKLSKSGAVTVPLEQAPWGDYFGMCVDKFGINWMVNCSPKK